jgi:two-component system KDP operon response regulator KdpE
MKVLIIEDSPEIVKSLSLTFKIRWPQAQVLIGEGGKQGIKLVESESPDIVILDINLPDMTGFEVLGKIRCFSKVPVVILTVREGAADRLKADELGANDYITKPFRPSDLLARIQAVLAHPRVQPDKTDLSRSGIS